jgi:hypothetical protein
MSKPNRQLIKAYLLMLLEEQMKCKRTTGTPRAAFDNQQDAVVFRDNPINWAYHDDIVVFCGRCAKFHLSHPTWLESRPWETIASQLRSN